MFSMAGAKWWLKTLANLGPRLFHSYLIIKNKFGHRSNKIKICPWKLIMLSSTVLRIRSRAASNDGRTHTHGTRSKSGLSRRGRSAWARPWGSARRRPRGGRSVGESQTAGEKKREGETVATDGVHAVDRKHEDENANGGLNLSWLPFPISQYDI